MGQNAKNTTALLIVDVQNGVLGKEGDTFKAEMVLNNLQNLIIKARGGNIPVIYVQHIGGHLVPNSFEWQIKDRIAPIDGEIRIQKHHPSSFHDTVLLKTLSDLGINELVIGGLQTEWCIDSTVRHAFSLGFKVTVVEDGHSTMDSSILKAEEIVEHHNSIFSGGFACLKPSSEMDFT